MTHTSVFESKIAMLETAEFVGLLKPVALGVAIAVLVIAIWTLATSRRLREVSQRNIFVVLIYLIFTIAAVGLAVTSFGSMIREGHLQHYALFLHMGLAGAFVFLLLAVSITHLLFRRRNKWWLESFSAWMVIASGLVSAGTMFLSMMPILDTAQMLAAAQVHRFAGLAVVAVLPIHLFSLVAGRFGWR